jgi:hypothetical protein
LIEIRDNPPKSVRFHLPRRGVRSAMAAILTLTILAPFLHGFVSLALEAGNPACGMQCCRTANSACHRPGHDGNHQFPRWTAGPQCPNGCGQVVSLTGPVCTGLTAGVLLAGPSLSATAENNPAQSSRVPSGAKFALFGRPPPFPG